MNGWCSFAIRLDGPPEKTGYSGAQKTHAKVGVVIHTMEYESTPEWNDATTLHNALFSDREASWTFSICRFFGGSLLFQHYPVGSVCWAQGQQGNLWLDSIENEGIAPEKFSEPQLALLVKTLRWIREEHGWKYDFWLGTRMVLLYALEPPVVLEHNAVPGAPATDCAVFTHGQVDPQRLLADLQEEDMVDQEARDRITVLEQALAGETDFIRFFGCNEVYRVEGYVLSHVPTLEALLAQDASGKVRVIMPDTPESKAFSTFAVEYATVPGQMLAKVRDD